MINYIKSNIRYGVHTSALVIIFIPIITYIIKFGRLSLSPDFQDWVDFSAYLSPFMVVSLTIFLAYISWQSLEIMKLKEKPVLVIEEYPEYNGDLNFPIPTFHFKIKNIGQGPAMNMRLFIRIREKLIDSDTFLTRKLISRGENGEKIKSKGGYHYMIHSFSLQPGEEIKINWQFHVVELAVVFEDLYSNTKTLIMHRNNLNWFDFDKIGIDKYGFKGDSKIFSNGKESGGKVEPRRVFTLGEVLK